ncbi:MAG: EAL domain-containing protein [Pseudobutyrivibrio sp.]|nr:EAL domain-containing protein [Pseudobutyrivibrio sp.]
MISSVLLNLFQAMEEHRLKAYFQPQYDATTGCMVSAEALARLVSPSGEIIPPDDFIPELEKTDAINHLDWYILEEACKALKQLGKNAIPISVNFSRWHVQEENFVDRLNGIINAYGVDPTFIEVEITESALVKECENIVPWAQKISEAGFRIAIDDFGKGLSSLQFVKDMPVDVIKIDKSFLVGDLENKRARRTLESVFYFANSLELSTVAEGVENVEQLKMLQMMDCRTIQGFLFARPMTENDFIQICNNKDADVASKFIDVVKEPENKGVMHMLLDAVYNHFPLIILGNLTQNSYYTISTEDGHESQFPAAGSFDELTSYGIKKRTGEDKDIFATKLSRENLLAAYRAGKDSVRVVTKEMDQGGAIKTIETIDYFTKHPSSDDILVVGLNRVLEA